jgi:hypothetical protein
LNSCKIQKAYNLPPIKSSFYTAKTKANFFYRHAFKPVISL